MRNAVVGDVIVTTKPALMGKQAGQTLAAVLFNEDNVSEANRLIESGHWMIARCAIHAMSIDKCECSTCGGRTHVSHQIEFRVPPEQRQETLQRIREVMEREAMSSIVIPAEEMHAMTNNHGGPRPGSGRPPKHGEPGINTSVRLTQDVREFLASFGTYTDGVLHLVEHSREWKQWKRQNGMD